MDFLRLTEV